MARLLDIRHGQAQRRLQATTGAAVARILLQTPMDRTAETRDTYGQGTSHVIAAGQHAAAQFAAAYVAAYQRPQRPVNLAAALAQILATPDSPRAVGGLAFLWSLLDQDTPEAQAREQAAVYASGIAQTDVQTASRAGMDEAADATGREARYRLELNPSACDWCHFIASTGDRYLSASSVPVPHSPDNSKHPGGPCGFTPAIEFEERGITPAPVRRYAHGRTIPEQ